MCVVRDSYLCRSYTHTCIYTTTSLTEELKQTPRRSDYIVYGILQQYLDTYIQTPVLGRAVHVPFACYCTALPSSSNQQDLCPVPPSKSSTVQPSSEPYVIFPYDVQPESNIQRSQGDKDVPHLVFESHAATRYTTQPTIAVDRLQQAWRVLPSSRWCCWLRFRLRRAHWPISP